jgi:hypothetical protein
MVTNEKPMQEVERRREEDRARWPLGQPPHGGDEVPLFLRDQSDGPKGNPQDEKDEVGE